MEVLLGIGCVGFFLAAIAGALQVRELQKQLRARELGDELSGIKSQFIEDLLERALSGWEKDRAAVFYHPETDQLFPFEDLEYLGEF